MIAESLSTATIANGASLSGAVNLQGARLFAIIMPATWTAADLTFQSCATEGGTFVDLYEEDGTEVTVDGAAARYIILEATRWLGVRWLKVRSGTASVAVNQGGARDITLVALA